MPPGKWPGTAEAWSLLSPFLRPCPLGVGSLLLPQTAGEAPASLHRWCSLRSTITGCGPGGKVVWMRSPWSAPPGAAELAPGTSLASGRGFLGSDDGGTISHSLFPLALASPRPLALVEEPGGSPAQQGNSAKCLQTQRLGCLLSPPHLLAPARQATWWAHCPSWCPAAG